MTGMHCLNHYKSLAYVSKMAYLWDLVALGKHQFDDNFMSVDVMFDTLDILSEEMKNVYFNYYEDYLRPTNDK